MIDDPKRVTIEDLFSKLLKERAFPSDDGNTLCIK
jgi:hypothetical protein